MHTESMGKIIRYFFLLWAAVFMLVLEVCHATQEGEIFYFLGLSYKFFCLSSSSLTLCNLCKSSIVPCLASFRRHVFNHDVNVEL